MGDDMKEFILGCKYCRNTKKSAVAWASLFCERCGFVSSFSAEAQQGGKRYARAKVAGKDIHRNKRANIGAHGAPINNRGPK